MIFSNLLTFKMITKFGNGAVVQISNMFAPVYHVAFNRVLWNVISQIYIQPCFSESLISEKDQLWGSSFFQKCSKLNLDFEILNENLEKAFCFWDNSIWIGCVNLSLLRWEYFSSAVNMLTNSYHVLHITKKDIFQLIYFQNDY